MQPQLVSKESYSPQSVSEMQNLEMARTQGQIVGLPKYVYVFRANNRDHGYKIGISDNPKRRSQNFNATILFVADLGSDAKRVEKFLLTKFRHKRLTGEWFDLNSYDVGWIRRFLQPYVQRLRKTRVAKRVRTKTVFVAKLMPRKKEPVK